MDPEDLLGKRLPYDGGLKLESILGYGSFATVYKAVNKEGQIFAVKWLNKIGMSDRDQALQKDEVMYMKMLGDHKNIIHLYDVIETSDSLFLILECCTTDLYELITQSEKAIEIPRVKRYFNEICDSVKHCHNNHIYHRDLKPENILISKDDHCKLSDFGLCCFDEWTNDFNCGSLRYMSPECIDNEDYDDDDYEDEEDEDSDGNYYEIRKRNEKTGLECNSRGSDIWALGVILINMIFGQNPWSSADMENPTFNMFIRKDPNVLQRKLGLSDEFNRVVKRMFAKNVYDRYSLEELRQEINRIEVFTDFSKRVSNYLGVDEELINMTNLSSYESEDDSQYDNVDEFDDWVNEDTFSVNDDHVIVPDIDTLELDNEEIENDEYNHDHNFSFNYMKSNIPVISQWGDDLDDDDDDMVTELTPKLAEVDDDEEEEEEECTTTTKRITSTTNALSSSYDDTDVPMSWESRSNSMENYLKNSNTNKMSQSESNKKMDIYDYSYENKIKEWEKEEEEDQMESEDNLTTPTIEKILSFNKGELFDKIDNSEKPLNSQKQSVQLPESIKTNDKSFNVDESSNEPEEEIFKLSINIKALDIENEKNHNNSSPVNKMVDSAISVSETNLSKEIKNLNLH
ncbi:Pkinase-domain-containing protein [Neocallimastix lanati (nom. inval.)]|nr:Pkinase-domain-containing protein [Neocallimastix sp. JGI-2020a]